MISQRNDSTKFESWLEDSIRRAWILAAAVAIPGAFFVTFWFPHSASALIGIAVLGIGIGITADVLRYARKYTTIERSRTALTLRNAIQKAATLIDRKLATRALPSEEAEALRLWLAELGKPRSYALTSMHLVLERLNAIHNLQISIADKITGQAGSFQTAPESEKPVEELLEKAHLEFLQQRESKRGRGQIIREAFTHSDTKFYGEILIKLSTMAVEMNVPIDELFGHLHRITSKEKYLEMIKQLHSTR